MPKEIRLPELGEGIEAADVVAVRVAPGDRVEREQPLIEIESEKASVEVPSPEAGTVVEVRVAPGDRVAPGQVIALVEAEGGGAETGAAAGTETEAASATEAAAAAGSAAGAGAETGAETATAAEAGTEAAAGAAAEEEPFPEAAVPPAQAAPGSPAGAPARSGAAPAPEAAPAAERQAAPDPVRAVPASPRVRRLARELGLDLTGVRGSGPRGRITEEDVKEAARRAIAAASRGGAPEPLPDLSAWGEVEREPMDAVRRLTAEAMAHSWSRIPHVTHHDRADITELEATRRRLAPEVEAAGGKLTVTAVLVRLAAEALTRFPRLNAAVDMERREIVYRRYVHIGVAVDTPRGLLVPVIRDAHRKGIAEIAAELADLAARARDRKLAPSEMQGAGFTISNLGGIGGTGFTPVVPWPQVAILGVSRAETRPVWNGEAFVPRLLLPLSLSYDHRLVDGADAARFLRWLCEALESPLRALL